MKLLKHIYKTKTLSEYGVFLFIALLLILLLGNIFIPEYRVQNIDAQLLKIKGKHFKFDDDPHVAEFIRSVKSNNGYICMGTSESTPLRDGNYYEFLDRDTSYATRFSILGGAGWSCGIHMAMLLNHQEEVDSLKLIYFINPVYWRSELNGFKKGYWTRYLNYSAYRHTVRGNMAQGFSEISNEYSEVLNPGEKFLFIMEYWLREIRKPFFRDLRYWLFPEEYEQDLSFPVQEKKDLQEYAWFGKIDNTYIDTSWNVTYEFKTRNWLNPIIDNDYRNRELIAFISLCNELNVNVIFILGPVNEIYIRKYHQPYYEGYMQAVAGIRDILDREGVDYIDATELGNIPGSFMDNQHHSSYGAYLIYQKIKTYIHEKNNH